MKTAFEVVAEVGEWVPGSTVDGYLPGAKRDPDNPEVGLVHVTHPSNFDQLDGRDVPGPETDFDEPYTLGNLPSWFKSDRKSREVIQGIIDDGMILNPIPVNVRQGMITDGHHRMLAAQRGGLPVPWMSVSQEGADHAALFAGDIFKPYDGEHG